MSTNEQTPVSQPTSVVRNTLGKDHVSQELGGPASDAALREYCDRNYHQLLPIIAEKVHQKKVQQEKLKAVKARLNFEEPSQHSELGTPSRRISLKERLGSKHVRSMSGSPEPRRGHSESPRKRGPEKKITFKRLEKVYSTGSEIRGIVHPHTQTIQGVDHTTIVVETLKAATRVLTQKKQSLLLKNVITKEHPREGGKHYQKARIGQEDIESQSQRGKGRVLRMTCPSHGYAKKHILSLLGKNTSKIRSKFTISSREMGESMKEFVRRYKLECRDVNGAPECMKIFGFMHGITNPELIKRLHDKISKSVDEMMRVTKAFLRGEAGAKTEQIYPSHKTPKEIMALDKIKFKPPPPMTTPVEKRNASKFCEFHGEVEHTTDECMHLKRQIEEMIKAGKMSHLIKELKQRREEDGTEGPMIIEAEMGGHFVHRMYVDGGSSLEIQYEHCFNRFRPEVKSPIIPATSPLVGISGEIIWPLGQISLFVKICDGEHSTSAWMNFMVVRSPSPYNEIIERPGVRRIHAVPSTAHGMLKFSVAASGYDWGSATYSRTQIKYREGCLPVRQKKRGQSLKRNKPIYEEVEKLVNAGVMKEVHYHSWLSNPVMVKKHDDSWRMCVDFKDLNKACPKDGYPMSEIDWKVESLCGYPFECFLDAYKGYHQIKMAKEDEEKTAFVTSQGIFCGSSPQLTISKVFEGRVKAKWKGGKPQQIPKQRSNKWKKSIAELPMLTAPKKKEELIMYMAAAKEAVSAVLMTYGDRKQMPIYFILADFIMERPEDDPQDTIMEDEEALSDPWILFTNGSSCIDGFESGLIITNPEGMEFTYALRFRFDATNNEAEYEALIAGLRIVEQIGVKHL
nr:reverse transcriptase domain-containing protein [Tanacetum cinerariifolium]